MLEFSHQTKTFHIANLAEAKHCFDQVIASAETTKAKLSSLIAGSTGLELMHALKFTEAGTTPFNDGPLNLVEQLNQMFTYLTSFVAVAYLLQNYSDFGPYKVNLGTMPGFDIESEDGRTVAAEVFSATHPNSNDKLNKDAKKLETAANAFQHRIAFYYSPRARHSAPMLHPKYPSVLIVPLLELKIEL